MTVNQPVRIAIVVSHAIQHFLPQYKSLQAIDGVEVFVIFGSSKGYGEAYDPEFGRSLKWDLDLGGFKSTFLTEVEAGVKPTSGQIVQALERFGPDAIVTYGYHEQVSRVALRFARREGIPTIYISDAEKRQDRSVLRRLVSRARLRRASKSIGYYLSVGDSNEEVYFDAGAGEESIIRAGFPIDKPLYEAAYVRRASLRGRGRSALGLSKDQVLVVMVGKLVPWKRQADLLKAAEHLSARHGDRYVVALAGTGPQEASLRDEAKSHRAVRFMGFIPPQDLPAFYATADVYAHVAERDAHSLAVTEAAYMGLPVVLSDRCGSWGPTDDVRPGTNGMTFPVGDIMQLTAAIESLGKDLDLRRSMGEQSHRIAQSIQDRAHHDAWVELRDRILVERA